MSDTAPLGQLTPDAIVKGAAAALAMVLALYLGFKGRAKSEPHDQDIPGLSQRIGALAACVFIGMIVYFLGIPQYAWIIAVITLVCLTVAIVSYTRYQFLTTTHIYNIERVAKGRSQRINILGGDTLTPKAKKHHKAGEPIQKLIDGCGGELGNIWDNSSRARTRGKYELSYIGMVVGATTTLGCVGIFFSWLFGK